MRKEVELWKTQGLADLYAAQKNVEIEQYYVAVFLCQQSVEKMLKSYFFFKKNTSPGQTHSLLYLATETEVPKKYLTFLRRLTPEFVNTRSPDAAYGSPSDLYDGDLAKEYLVQTEEIVEWLNSQMKA